MILIAGYDEAGILYGVMDFQNYYLGTRLYEDSTAFLNTDNYFDTAFARLPKYEKTSAPAFENRGIWTWGHCIYDYRAFFDNMMTLKLNQVVIWNDYAPINGREIVDYAHNRGIKVYWGFSWGWDVDCLKPGFRIDDDAVIEEWGEKVLRQYRDNYAGMGGDGVYFQSFTELKEDKIGDVVVADAVVKWVNRIGGRLLDKYPNLQIQFGLHATSVNTHLDMIAKVDTRIRIVWEDCGSFPYDYRPNQIDYFDSTMKFNEQICALRDGKEQFGAVLKGMTKLDWSIFEHQAGSFVLGYCDERLRNRRRQIKSNVWKILQSYWLENSEYARRMISQIAELTSSDAHMQILVEDGCFEDFIPFPVALCAQMLWDPSGTSPEIIGQTARIPSVRFEIP